MLKKQHKHPQMCPQSPLFEGQKRIQEGNPYIGSVPGRLRHKLLDVSKLLFNRKIIGITIEEAILSVLDMT